jgi:formylglycine-generating enzyme
MRSWQSPLVAACLALACGGRAGGDPAGSGGDGGASGNAAAGAPAAGTGGSGGAQFGRCPKSTRGAKLLFVASPVRYFCIDEAEVRVDHYQAFLEDAPPASAQPPECANNSSFEPARQAYYSHPGERPIRYVDWCDARAYCAWAGKRLCGRIEGGGAAPAPEHANPAVSEWYSACSRFGQHGWSMGPDYQANRCVDRTFDPTWGPDPWDPNIIAAIDQCVGSIPGLNNMSGNLAEWENSCDADNCRVRGGSYLSSPDEIRCDASRLVPRDQAPEDVGFRCCADAE